jgi:hypothetical protein
MAAKSESPPTTSPGTTSSASCIALGRIPPAEAETEYYDQLDAPNRPAHRTSRVHQTRDGLAFAVAACQYCTLGAPPHTIVVTYATSTANATTRHDQNRTDIWLAAAARDEFAAAECLPRSLKAFDR